MSGSTVVLAHELDPSHHQVSPSVQEGLVGVFLFNAHHKLVLIDLPVDKYGRKLAFMAVTMTSIICMPFTDICVNRQQGAVNQWDVTHRDQGSSQPHLKM